MSELCSGGPYNAHDCQGRWWREYCYDDWYLIPEEYYGKLFE